MPYNGTFRPELQKRGFGHINKNYEFVTASYLHNQYLHSEIAPESARET